MQTLQKGWGGETRILLKLAMERVKRGILTDSSKNEHAAASDDTGQTEKAQLLLHLGSTKAARHPRFLSP